MSDQETYYVVYEVQGFAGEHKAGPYSWDEMCEHTKDIEGYEGVFNVHFVNTSMVDECPSN